MTAADYSGIMGEGRRGSLVAETDRAIAEENRRYLDDPDRDVWLDEHELASRGLAFLTLCGLGPALARRAEAAAATLRGS